MSQRKNAAARLRRNRRKAAKRRRGDPEMLSEQYPGQASTGPPVSGKRVAKTNVAMPDGSYYLQDDIPTVCPKCTPGTGDTELVNEQLCPSHMPSVEGVMDAMSRLHGAYLTATMEAGDGGSNRVICDSVHRGAESPRPIETPVVHFPVIAAEQAPAGEFQEWPGD